MTVNNLEVAVKITLENATIDHINAMPAVIEYLKQNFDEVHEFCLQVQDAYAIKDRRMPVVILGYVLQHALK